MRWPGWLAAAALLLPHAGAADWPGYKRLTREQVVGALAQAASGPADFYSTNLSGLDLSGIDFKGANLAAAVLNGAKLTGANLSRCNLTVSFAEGADLAAANLQGAMMFSMQLQGANLKGANLSGARLIGDLRRANLEQAVLTRLDGAADMKNQSMGLMRASIVSANLKGADLSGSDFSRADFSFSDLSGARLAGTRLAGAEFSGTDLRGANLAGADLSGAKLIDTDFTGANLANTNFTAATFRGVKGLPVQIAQQGEAAAGDERVLRVCEDPNNLPFSNRAGEGFENKIAELLARELGWKLEYTWFPQRMGFIRNTLRARDPGSNRFKCDLVMGVPVGFELASTTQPYYRSTYALAYVKGRGLDSVTAPEALLRLEPAKLKSLKLGVFGQSPAADWLLKHGLFGQAVSYQPQSGDPERYPGEIVEKDLVSGAVDVAFVWGPIAGYFAKNAAAELAVVPFEPSPEIQFDFRIAMAVRFGEREWKERIERLIEANRPRLQAILAAYGVPQLDDAGRFMTVAPDPALGRGGAQPGK